MAQEITAQAFLSVLKNGATDNIQANGAFTQAGDNFCHQVLTCATGDQALDLGTVGAPGWVFFRSLPDNTGDNIEVSDVVIGGAGDGIMVLEPGEFCITHWQQPAVHILAVSGQLFEYLIIEA